jgi:hypothetical protein
VLMPHNDEHQLGTRPEGAPTRSNAQRSIEGARLTVGEIVQAVHVGSWPQPAKRSKRQLSLVRGTLAAGSERAGHRDRQLFCLTLTRCNSPASQRELSSR